MATRARPALADGQEWDRLEAALARGATRGPGKPGPSKEVADLFDESELRDLRRLAEHAQLVRSRSPVLGNVIFLHGITGADLAVVEARGMPTACGSTSRGSFSGASAT